MRLIKILIFLLVFCPTLCVAQTPPAAKDNNATIAKFVKSIHDLLAQKSLDTKSLHDNATRLAKTYSPQLKDVKKQADDVVKQAGSRLDELGWREKWNLAVEMWRVRGSLDLLSLLDADSLSQITGMSIPDLRTVKEQFAKATKQIKSYLPLLNLP